MKTVPFGWIELTMFNTETPVLIQVSHITAVYVSRYDRGHTTYVGVVESGYYVLESYDTVMEKIAANTRMEVPNGNQTNPAP